METPLIEVTGVTKRFRQRQRSEKPSDVWRNLVKPTFREVVALNNISLTVERGEVVAYAGANGAGKSTTVKLCSGMLSPDSGTVRVFGMDPVLRRVEYVARIGVVFGQRTELWFDHPVSASFEWKRVVWDIPSEKYHRMLAFVKQLLDLGEFFNTSARELSLGQRMRADLALALIHEPEILILDEPTLGLDVLAKRQVLSFISSLNRDQNVTILVTSHDMSDLEQLAGRIVMVDRGKIAFDGNFERLRREYAHRRQLMIETDAGAEPPMLRTATYVSSELGRHTYSFDAATTTVSELLAEAAAQTIVLDVETHRPDIDEVIADIYEQWRDRSNGSTAVAQPHDK